jgi:ABC-type lipoprotein export system ATPase subunit
MSAPTILSAGAKWRRWDPHIHTPDTLLNDQFDCDWDTYIDEIEKRTPTVEALGITDYYCLENYLKVVEYKKTGRLPNVSLVFPNIELRLNIETKAKKAINFHLLFSPDDPDHVNMIRRAMQELKFESKGVDHSCTRNDLIRLGRSRLGSSCDEIRALREGANQFKVTFRDVLRVYRSNPWMKNNCLMAVSGSSNDGTSGLQGDDGWSESREEIERNSHIILIATESDRLYWLGKKDGFDKKHIETKYGCLKPCVHGSDAHRVDQVLEPAKGRYCWIKGDPTFEALRQIVLEPDSRVHIGELPPIRNEGSDWIKRVTTSNTPWLEQNDIGLNDGLIAIIGARGSGKTALADIIARAARVDQAGENDKSFLHRAAAHLEDARVEMEWDAGEPSNASLWTDLRRREREYGFDSDDDELSRPTDQASVRYLSQQFVERLCSSTGLHSELVDEIERVIFNSIRPDDKMDCDSFGSLVSLRVDPIQQTRSDLQMTIAGISNQIVVEDEMIENHAKYARAVTDTEKAFDTTERAINTLVPKGNAERANKLASISAVHTELSTTVERERRRLQRCGALRQEVANVTSIQAPQRLATLKQSFHDIDLPDADWNNFLLTFKGNVEAVIKAREKLIQEQIAKLSKSDPARSHEYRTLAAEKLPLEQLAAQKLELERLVGIDKANLAKYEGLKTRLEQESRARERAKNAHERAKGAQGRRDELIQRRRDHYRQCFQTFMDESAEREDLYAILHESFKKGTGTINGLRFSVARAVNIERWLIKSEELFDFRMDSELRGHTKFRETVKDHLYQSWLNGSSQAVSEAMTKFISTSYKQMLRLKPPNIQTLADVAQWQQNVAAWLYSTDHISLTYSMEYEGVPIERLSPGTRGIVLLMLYLVIDKHDKRPLLIDQPEENLDPRSVYQELVHHFREARHRRQVIIVTHNANLVVNTDADQVIVASTTPNPDGGLPTIRYEAGCLEDKAIRTAVCEILEGGERAFIDREKRYRLQRNVNEMIS